MPALRHLAVLIVATSALGACGILVGIEDTNEFRASGGADAGPDANAGGTGAVGSGGTGASAAGGTGASSSGGSGGTPGTGGTSASGGTGGTAASGGSGSGGAPPCVLDQTNLPCTLG